jgi:hypothetical protein
MNLNKPKGFHSSEFKQVLEEMWFGFQRRLNAKPRKNWEKHLASAETNMRETVRFTTIGDVATRRRMRRKYRSSLTTARNLLEETCLTWIRETSGVKNFPIGLLHVYCQLKEGELTLTEFKSWISQQSSPQESTSTLSWEVLPPGWHQHPKTLHQIRQEFNLEMYSEKLFIERLHFVESLAPRCWYRSKLGASNRYFVAKFDEVVIAESVFEGNALYYYFTEQGDWKEVFCLTKTEARSKGAQRIVHRNDDAWKNKLQDLVR